MTFLPIVERELRVAARRRGAFWLRVLSAVVALLLGAGFLVLALLLERLGMGQPAMGRGLFWTLTWLGLAAALSAGAFFTSDAISRERREGTLGFLFLTDLRGYDVVLGKLLAAGWRASFALLAAMPVLAVTLLLGGVSGVEFWRTMLALGNALFCSLVVGMFVSALCRAGQWALFVTLAGLAVWVAGGPLLDGALALLRGGGFDPVLALTSPGFVFLAAGYWQPGAFWEALLVNQVLAWALLGATCALTRRAWRETGGASWTWLSELRAWWRYGGARRRAALRRKLLDRSPVQWLACRERWQNVVAWAVAALSLLALGTMWWVEVPELMWVLWSGAASVLGFVLNVVVASQASRMFIEARQTGALELMLISPLSSEQMVRGQWRALVRLFGWPVGLFLVAGVIGAFFAQFASGSLLSPGERLGTGVAAALAVLGAVGSLADFVALAWFGMWMGVTNRSITLATLLTI
ncbi:MAG: hypothetical protein RMK20_10090, partial [Verrucomicrobiales bacterium]|nr:hypothetical protein [Verrucomicrobiales bacterium]